MIGNYEQLRQTADTHPRRLVFLVILADLTYALDRLDQRGWEVMLLCGLLGLTQDHAAKLLQTSPRNVSRWLADAYEDVHYYINGGS